MKYENFIAKLKEVPFQFDEYRKIGLKESYIDNNIKSYSCNFKTNKLDSSFSDEILKMVDLCNVQKVQIGMIVFYQEVEEEEEFFKFGEYDKDILGISKTTLEAVLLDNSTSDLVYSCAQNGKKFLDALIVAAKFLESRIINANQELNSRQMRAAASLP